MKLVIDMQGGISDSVQALTDFGYDYCLSKTVSPQSEEYEEVYSSRESLDNPVTICVGVQMDIMMPVMDAHLAKPLDVKKAIDIICKLVGRK